MPGRFLAGMKQIPGSRDVAPAPPRPRVTAPFRPPARGSHVPVRSERSTSWFSASLPGCRLQTRGPAGRGARDWRLLRPPPRPHPPPPPAVSHPYSASQILAPQLGVGLLFHNKNKRLNGRAASAQPCQARRNSPPGGCVGPVSGDSPLGFQISTGRQCDQLCVYQPRPALAGRGRSHPPGSCELRWEAPYFQPPPVRELPCAPGHRRSALLAETGDVVGAGRGARPHPAQRGGPVSWAPLINAQGQLPP